MSDPGWGPPGEPAVEPGAGRDDQSAGPWALVLGVTALGFGLLGWGLGSYADGIRTDTGAGGVLRVPPRAVGRIEATGVRTGTDPPARCEVGGVLYDKR